MHSILMLWDCPLERVFIKNFDAQTERLFSAERNELYAGNLFLDFMGQEVQTIEALDRNNLCEMLQGNIAFVHYYAVPPFDVVLDCIASHTPLLVNDLPAITEYLGQDYPLYYYSYPEASEKAQDNDLILQAHEQLKYLSEQGNFSLDYVKKEIRSFCRQ